MLLERLGVFQVDRMTGLRHDSHRGVGQIGCHLVGNHLEFLVKFTSQQQRWRGNREELIPE